MRKWLPLLSIFLLITPPYIVRTANAYYVVDLLVAILLAVLLREFTDHRLRIGLLSVCLLVCFFHSDALLLSPFVFAAGFSENDPAPPVVFAVACMLLVAYHYNIPDTYLLFILLLLAFVIRYGTEKLLAAQARYHALYNDMQETRLRLEHALSRTAESKQREVELALLTERNRMTRDMHDGLGHILSRSILQIGALETLAHEPAKSRLGPIRRSLEDAMYELRANLHNLKEENFNLRQEVEKLLAEFTYCRTALTYTIQTPLSLDVSYSILAILQEALSNIIKHSDADFVQIKCLETKDRVFITIADNGTRTEIRSFGIGLGSIRERARSMGGRAEFITQNGFAVRVFIPKEAIHATARH